MQGLRQTIRLVYGIAFGALTYLAVHEAALRGRVALGAAAGGAVFVAFVVAGEALEQRRLARAARRQASAREREIVAEERLRARIRREEEARHPSLYTPCDN